MKYLSLVAIFICFGADAAVYHTPSSKVIAPFGLSSGQPPGVRTIQVIDFEVGFTASQVCGYTDWSTVQLHLPKQLLSKEYWQKIGAKLGQQARNVVLQISGALPSMIACNISPQFCSVYNQAEAMAGFEAGLTADSCKVLDGISDMTQIHHEPFRKCVSGKLKTDYALPGQALASCNTGEKDKPATTTERQNHIAGEIKNDEYFTMEQLIEKILPGKVKTSSGTHELNSGGRVYSRYFKTKEFAKELFPGISVNGRGKVRHGGTFQNSPESKQREEKQAIKDEVKRIYSVMVDFKQQGFSDLQIVSKSEYLWNDRNEWKKKGEPSKIMRPSKDEEDPSFLIQPSQILMLIPLADLENKRNSYMSEELEMMIDQLSSNAAYITQIDKLRDLYSGAEEKCLTDPDLHSVIAQQNCDLIISRTKASIEMLMIKQQTEDRAFELHQKIAGRVRARQLEKVSRFSREPVGERDSGLFQEGDAILIPGKY